ncbi:uncharacterized protein E0L32_006756 [Thyridium curvatum]|uniref:Lipid droplet-associated hydrolase n=1 Tax=Thyridium curvatum TaxID=1093900 RepID=A0A507B1G0_9PEZI|nr:uncharacterized protein E0L32_006756 [Thyridium curvatum]TPX12876.1 hypothetical protein E0L32_006756 [Thyridium curvatum]
MTTYLSFPPRHRPDAEHAPDTNWVLVWHITGNPGLITYYHTYMSTLRTLLDSTEDASSHRTRFHIAGRNLLGFEDADHSPPFDATHKPYDLEAQILHIAAAVSAERIPAGPRKGQPFDAVILSGHSVGSYIIVELFHRHQQQSHAALRDLPLRAGVCLFPTISHLPRSDRGRAAVSLMNRFPAVADRVHLLPRALFYLWPAWLLAAFFQRAWGFTAEGAATTARWLQSRDGAHEAAFLGMDELRTITEEKWGEELWEVTEAEAATRDQEPPPKFFFYYAQYDHWVADEVRDEFIRVRAEHASRDGVPAHKRGRTRTYVDETGKLTHEFCAKEGMSEMVAERVKTWIEEIVAN